MNIVSIQKRFRESYFLKDISKVLSSNVFVLGLSFCSNVLVSRYLGVDSKGVLAFVLLYPTLVVNFCEMGIRQVAVYEIGRQKFEYGNIINNIISLFIVNTIFGIVVCFFLIYASNNNQVSSTIILLSLAIIPINLVKSYVGGIFLGKKSVGMAIRMNWLPAILYIILVCLLVVYMDLGVFGAVLSTVLAGLPVAIYGIYKVLKEIKIDFKVDRKIIKSFLSLGVVYALSFLLSNLNYRVDFILLEKYSSTSELGLYSIGVAFAELVLQVPTALAVVIFSHSANAKDPKSFSNKVIKMLKVSLILAIILGLILVGASPYLIPFIYGSDFEGSTSMLQIIMPGIIGLVVYKIIAVDLAGRGKPWIAIYATLPGLFINVVLNYYLIPEYGGNGAAFASSISYIFIAICCWFIYKSFIKNL